MLINKEDIENLCNINFNPFYLDYCGNNYYDKKIHNKLVEYIESKNFKTLRLLQEEFDELEEYFEATVPSAQSVVALLRDNKIQGLNFNYSERIKYKREFLSTFIGEDINELNGLFINYQCVEMPKYFHKKGVLAMNRYTRNCFLSLTGRVKNNYCDLKNIDINLFYTFHDKMFENLNKNNLYKKHVTSLEKYLKERKNVNFFMNQSIRTLLFINKLQAEIVFKRPLSYINNLLKNNEEQLRCPEVINFIKTVNAKVMPDIFKILNESLENSKKYQLEDIKVEEEKQYYKIFNLDLEKIAFKYTKSMEDCEQIINKVLTVAGRVLNVEINILNKEKFISFLIKGEEKNISIASEVLSNIMNNKNLLTGSIKEYEQYFSSMREKELIESAVDIYNNINNINKRNKYKI